MKTMSSTTITITGIIVLVCLNTWNIMIYHQTLTGWTPILAIATAGTALLWLPTKKIWKRMFPSTKTWVRATAHAITAASLIVFIILAGNYYIEDASSEHREEVTVQQKFSRKRQQTRRIRGRVYSSGKTYYVYYITVKFDNGRTKEMQISLKQYNRIRTGTRYHLQIGKGVFGLPIIKSRNIM